MLNRGADSRRLFLLIISARSERFNTIDIVAAIYGAKYYYSINSRVDM